MNQNHPKTCFRGVSGSVPVIGFSCLLGATRPASPWHPFPEQVLQQEEPGVQRRPLRVAVGEVGVGAGLGQSHDILRSSGPRSKEQRSRPCSIARAQIRVRACRY